MKDVLLQKLDELSFDEFFGFKWENAHRLTKSELEFLLTALHASVIHRKCLLKLTKGDTAQVQKLIEEVLAEDGVEVDSSATKAEE